MTLRLPTPLPYDYVDELLDSTIEFTTGEIKGYEEYDEVITKHTARRRDNLPLGNCARMMFSIINDNAALRFTDEREDGYCTWHTGRNSENFVWESVPPTEEEIDKIMDWMF